MKLNSPVAFRVNAFYIKIKVEPKKGSTDDGSNFGIITFERAFSSRIFPHPISDACLAEHFTTRMALPGVANNLAADKALKAV